MDAVARLRPLEPWPRLAHLLADWDPPDRPKLFRVLCVRPINGEHLCPQSFGELLPAALRGVARATKLRALDGLPPVKPSDWLLDHDGWYDLKDDGAYVVTRRRPRPVQPGWRHSLAEHYPVGRRELPEPVKHAAGYDSDTLPGLQFHIVGHVVVLPATIICPRCGARNSAEPPYDMEPYWRARAAALRAQRTAGKL
jgi:hypothetical protein